MVKNKVGQNKKEQKKTEENKTAQNEVAQNRITQNKTTQNNMNQNKTIQDRTAQSHAELKQVIKMSKRNAGQRYDIQTYILRGLRMLFMSVLALMLGSLIGLNGFDNTAFGAQDMASAHPVQKIFAEISGNISERFASIFQIKNQKVIVLDAGHGGFDSGKVGANGSLEKEINLQITEKCKKYLEQSGYKVVMTREDDNGLYDEASSNKKREDMNARVNLMNTSEAVLAVSIHQNSYTGAACSGAQVFYYTGSESGKQLAGYIQDSIIVRVQPRNTRQIKANSDYFILKHSKVPTVIVECGFLSNTDEEQRLCDDTYQEKLAWAITMGIVQYCAQEENS